MYCSGGEKNRLSFYGWEMSNEGEKREEQNFIKNFEDDLAVLQLVFNYLKTTELLVVAKVSKFWKYASTHSLLLKTDRLNDCKQQDGLKEILKNETETLDLLNIIFPDSMKKQVTMYKNLFKKINRVSCLTKIYIDVCPADVLPMIVKAAPQLKAFDMGKVMGLKLDLAPISKLINLIEFKLEGFNEEGIELYNPEHLNELKNLRILRLKNVTNMQDVVRYIPPGLVSLDLGPCGTLTTNILGYRILPILQKLKILRLDTCVDPIATIVAIKAILALPDITELDLINFSVMPILEIALAQTEHIKKLHVESSFILDEGEVYLEDDRDFNQHNILRAYYKNNLDKEKKKKKKHIKTQAGKEGIQTPLEILKLYSAIILPTTAMKKMIKKFFHGKKET